MYSTVQTGANNQLGGVNTGLVRVGYQVDTLLCVAMALKKPTIKQIVIIIRILIALCVIIVLTIVTNLDNIYDFQILKSYVEAFKTF